MEYTGLFLALTGLLIANVTVFPAFSRNYPSAAMWLNVASAGLNTTSGLIAVLVYKAKAAAAILTPSTDPERALRASFFVSLIGCLVAVASEVVAVMRQYDFMRVLGMVVVVIGILTALRIGIQLTESAEPPGGSAAASISGVD